MSMTITAGLLNVPDREEASRDSWLQRLWRSRLADAERRTARYIAGLPEPTLARLDPAIRKRFERG